MEVGLPWRKHWPGLSHDDYLAGWMTLKEASLTLVFSSVKWGWSQEPYGSLED